MVLDALYCGVTVIVAVTGIVLVFSALKAVIFPVPHEASPIDELSFVQVYEVPVPEKLIVGVELLLQITTSVGSFAVGVGLIEIVNVLTDP